MCDVDDEKPFVCSASGCGMRFTNEDHLNVHLKKHEMSLALNQLGGHNTSPAHHFLDQTPTPTKFLKNCEEIGLFQELSKNPFEEAFKKASDSEGVPLPGPQSNELNTPIPPAINDKTPGGFLLNVVSRSALSPTSNSLTLSKAESILNTNNGLALNLSGKSSSEKIVAMQPSSTTSEEERVSSVISLADSTQSPSKTVSPGSLGVKEVVITQAVSSSLSGSKPASSQVNLSSPASIPPTLVAQPTVAATPPQTLTAASPSHPGQQTCTMQVFLQLPTGQTVPVHIPATISTVLPGSNSEQQPVHIQQSPSPKAIVRQPVVTTSPSVTSTSTMALKQKLKQTLQAQQQQQGVVSSSSMKVEPGVPVLTVQSQVSPVMVRMESPRVEVYVPDSVSKSYEPSSKRHKSSASDSEDPDERRRKFLERNRAAAARCRQKRKHWICNLERKAEELQQTNNKLQSEVSLLRGEVAQLKTLLLAHQDCPITLQQKSQGQLALHTISMLESAASVPFEVTHMVSNQHVTSISALVTDSLDAIGTSQDEDSTD